MTLERRPKATRATAVRDEADDDNTLHATGKAGKCAKRSKVSRGVEHKPSVRRAGAAQALRLAHVGVWHLDMRTGQTTWSEQACGVMGFAPGEISHLDEFMGRLAVEGRKALAALLHGSGTGPFSIDLQVACADGSIRHVSLRGDMIRDDGQPLAAAGIVESSAPRDYGDADQQAITHRRMALFEYAPDGILIADLTGRYIDANPGACHLLGYSREELMELRASDILTSTELHQVQRSGEGTGKRSQDCEWQCRRKDGTVFAVDLLTMAMPDGNVIAMIRDITGRRLAEAALVRSTAETERINRALSFQKFALDQHAIVAITDRAGRITYVNDKFCEISGYPREELIGKDHRIINSDYHPPEFFKDLYSTIAHGRVWRGEIRNRAKDGRIYWVDTTIVPFRDDSDRVTGYVAIRADITARKLAEEEIERVNLQLTAQNRRLLALTDQAHRFVDDVSHEFRTPLAVIKEFAAIIADGLAGPTSREQLQYLGIVDNAVVDLNQLVEDFLDSSKLRAGRLRVDRRPQIVPDVFARIRPGLQKKAAGRGITIIERIDAGLPLVFIDEEKVRRVIMNLATNAIKFSPEKAQIELWARMATDGGVEIGVTDYGRGLSQDDLSQLFERFRQLPSAEAPCVKGFGLGLNIARRLVWLNLGSMHVTSEIGKGATFSFTLPTSEPHMIVNRFFSRLAECEEAASSIAVISVVPHKPTESIDSLRLFLAATTRPTDVILELPCPADNGLLVLGPTESAEGWVSRLLRVRERAISDDREARLGAINIEVIGTFAYPNDVERATACVLEHTQRQEKTDA